MHFIALLPWFKRIVDTFYSISFIANTFQRNTVIDCELEKNNYIIELFKNDEENKLLLMPQKGKEQEVG